jgi:hypothetical protein
VWLSAATAQPDDSAPPQPRPPPKWPIVVIEPDQEIACGYELPGDMPASEVSVNGAALLWLCLPG